MKFTRPPKSEARPGVVMRVVRFYIEGFRAMTLGRYLWVLILVKVAILFLVFKIFFFPDRLARDYDNDNDRARAVRRHLADPRGQVAVEPLINSTFHPEGRMRLSEKTIKISYTFSKIAL